MSNRSKWVSGIESDWEFQGELNREGALELSNQYYEDLKDKALGQLEQVINAIRAEALKGMVSVVWDPKIFSGCSKIQHSDYTGKLVEELVKRNFKVVVQRNGTEEFKLLIGWQREQMEGKRRRIFNSNYQDVPHTKDVSKDEGIAYIKERVRNRNDDSWLEDD